MCLVFGREQLLSAELPGLAVAAPVKHQLNSAFRRPPGLTSPSPGGLPVSPHTSTDHHPASTGHSPTVGAHPPSHSPGSHPSAMQAGAGHAMPPLAASSGKPVCTSSTTAVPPPVTGYAVADYSTKVNNMFDIVEVPADEVVCLLLY